MIDSHEATEWESRTVVFERSEFTGLGFFGSFFCQEKNEHSVSTHLNYR